MHFGLIDLSTIDVLKSIENNDGSELNNDEDLIFKETVTTYDKITDGNSSKTEKQLNTNSESCHEQKTSNVSSETVLKTSSRPQRQAAKRAENQIRVILYTLLFD